MLHSDDGQEAWPLSSYFLDDTLWYVGKAVSVDAALRAHSFDSAVHYHKVLHRCEDSLSIRDYHFIEGHFHHSYYYRYE